MRGLWLLGFCLFALSATSVKAQLPSPILPQQPKPLPTPQTSPPPPALSPLPAPTSPSPAPPIAPATIRVDRFEFEGNTAFSAAELTAATQSFLGRELTFAELLQVEAVVTQKYTEAGFINSGAVIPAGQTFARTGAIVTVKIIEGGLEAIQVTGTHRLNPAYVRSRLELATRPPLNRNRLLAALQLLQLDPLIEQISAELQAGARPDRSLLAVRVQEADTFTAGVFADNGRSPSVGQFRRGASLTQANLLGIGDRIELVYTNTDGSNTGDLIYRVPLNPHNGTLQFAFSITDTRVIEEPFDRIDITGNSRIYELTYRQPVLQKPDREWAIGLTAARAESETALLDQPFPLSPGADEQGRTRISALRFFQEFVQRNPRAVFAARSQFSIGVDWFDATRNDDAPDSRFFAWRGQAQYIRLLAPDTLLLLRTDLQFATDALLPLEQFGIGGLLSVRGYRQDALLTDNGAFASIELRVPVLRVPQVNGVLQLTPFVDAGVGWNVSEDNLAQEFDSDRGAQTLVSAGLGLLWRMGDRFSARLDYGFPLIRLDGDEDTWKQDGLYFRVEYFPF